MCWLSLHFFDFHHAFCHCNFSLSISLKTTIWGLPICWATLKTKFWWDSLTFNGQEKDPQTLRAVSSACPNCHNWLTAKLKRTKDGPKCWKWSTSRHMLTSRMATLLMECCSKLSHQLRNFTTQRAHPALKFLLPLKGQGKGKTKVGVLGCRPEIINWCSANVPVAI